jgi:predicted HD phosphohydrolase
MNSPFPNKALLTPENSGNQNALLVASLLHMMSHYSAHGQKEGPCLKLAAVIERHLTALSRLPDVDPVLRATCEQLSETWSDLVDVALPAPAKRNFLARLMSIDGKRSEICSS